MRPQISNQNWASFVKIFIVGAGIGLVLTISGLFFIRSDAGHEFARKKLNEFLSDKLQGRFELKHLDEIGFDHVIGRDLIITAPNDEKVIELRKISMKPVWSKILSGSIQASSATVTGGIFRITEMDHSLSIIKALNSPPKPPGEKGEPIHLLIDDIHANDIEVRVTSKSLPPLIFKDIDSLIRFETDGKVTVTLEKASGHVDFPVLGDTKLRQLSGRIKSKVMDVIDFRLHMELGNLVPTHFIYRVPKNEKKPGDPKMIIRFSKEKSPDFFHKLVLNMADAFSKMIDVGFDEDH